MGGKNGEKTGFNAFFCRIICIYEKIVVILHAFSSKGRMRCPLVYRYYTGFWFREARFDSSVDNKREQPHPNPPPNGREFNEKGFV